MNRSWLINVVNFEKITKAEMLFAGLLSAK
jgi:hypothetical protein